MRTLIRSPSLSRRLVLRTPVIMTMRGEGDSRRIDLLEYRTTLDKLMEGGIETSLELRGKTYTRRDGRNNLTRVSK